MGFTVILNEGGAGTARDVSLRSVADSVRGKDVPWQICASSLQQMSSPTLGIEHAGIYSALMPVGEETLVCRGLGWVREPDFTPWLAALGNRFPGRKLRLPPYFPEETYGPPLEEAGLEQDSLSQFEMRLTL